MIVQVKFFALAQQEAGCESLELELSEDTTVGQFKTILTGQLPALGNVLQHALIALNRQYADDATVIPSDAELAIIPPVSGG